jgi:hypothetical protein
MAYQPSNTAPGDSITHCRGATETENGSINSSSPTFFSPANSSLSSALIDLVGNSRELRSCPLASTDLFPPQLEL